MSDNIRNGINHSQINRDPFGFQDNYHHYEPKIYDLRCYYGGFNLRQLKRIMFIFNQFAFSFQGYLQYLGNKERDGRFVTPREQSVLKYYTKSYELINAISDGLAKMPNTSETRYISQSDTFYKDQDRRSMLSIDKMKDVKWKRHVKDENGNSTWETEYYVPSDNDQLRFVNDTLSVTYTWGYWIEYFRISILEGDELEGLDVPMFNDLIENLKNLLINLKQCPWYTGCKNIKI